MKTIYFLAMIFVVASCVKNEPAEENSLGVTEKTARLVKAQNDFGIDLFKNVLSTEKEKQNIMISPLSVSMALSMTYNGAGSSTKTAMEKTLRVYGLSPEDINQSCKDLADNLKSLDNKVLLELANAIFYRESFHVENEFISVNNKNYGAQVIPLDFTSPKSLEVINGWVNEKTHGKIEKIVDIITPEQVMFLLNAVYFKGIWTKEFNPKSTVNSPFEPEPGRFITVPFMQKTDTVAYFSNELFSSVKLNYGKGNYSMYLFLPNSGKSTADFASSLNTSNWNLWMGQYKLTNDVDLRLPKVKFAYEIKLNDILSDMGMQIAFTGAADFTGINRNGGLYIEYVKHKSFIEINEEGTEAAAVTIVAIDKNSAGPQKKLFSLNRPFLFAITEKNTGAILFTGSVKNPLLMQQ